MQITPKTTIIIPARWGSTRFEGKPLAAHLTGTDGVARPLIWWTYQAACQALPGDQVWVATDDMRIADSVKAFGAQVLMTSTTCRNGTERVQEAAEKLGLAADHVVVNVQGDAPLTPPEFIQALIAAMTQKPDTPVATPALRCDSLAFKRLLDQRRRGLIGGTTLVRSNSGKALYFSKEILPFADSLDSQKADLPVFHHVGLYAYRRTALDTYVSLTQGILEQIEGLEQLRFLENDIPIECVEVKAAGKPFWEVNNPEDIDVVNQHL